MYKISKNKLHEDNNGNLIIPDEICRDIFYYKQEQFHYEDVKMYLEEYLDRLENGEDSGLNKDYVEKVLTNPTMMDDVVCDYEKVIDNTDNGWADMVRSALEYNQTKYPTEEQEP